MDKTFDILPRIVEIKEMKLMGMPMTMSLANNKTALLWKTFMPLRHEILNKKSQDLISLQIYSPHYFSAFNAQNEFAKWACVEVDDVANTPEGMETIKLPASVYAVFDYKGLSTDTSIFQYIFGAWLPSSPYVLDQRPHFEVLGEKYKNNDVNSEEQIYIPIKSKI
jgi:AraC family transcriptional regulator